MINYIFLSPALVTGAPTPGLQEKARGQKGLLLLKDRDPEPERKPRERKGSFPRAQAATSMGGPGGWPPTVLLKAGLKVPPDGVMPQGGLLWAEGLAPGTGALCLGGF